MNDLATYCPPLEPRPVLRLTDEDLFQIGLPRGRDYHHARLSHPFGYLARVREIVRRLPELAAEGSWVLLHGRHGYGKTAAGVAILREAMARRGRAWFFDAARVPHAFSWRSEQTFDLPTFDFLCRRQVLLLDDLGAEFPNDDKIKHDPRAMLSLLTERYHHRLFTIITSNFSVAELSAEYPSLATHLHHRLLPIHCNEHQWR